MKRKHLFSVTLIILTALLTSLSFPQAKAEEGEVITDVESFIYQPGKLTPTASEQKLSVGDVAPDFSLVDVAYHMRYKLSQYRGKKNVLLFFIPAAWTPVCSVQLPGYCKEKEMFEKYNVAIFGIGVDNAASLHAWTSAMGDVWFPILSDFWPHGEVASKYGVLRTDGFAERALFLIDKEGKIRFIEIYDINFLPDIKNLEEALKNLE